MDSGHQSVEDGDIYAELPARIADMELQIKTLKDNNKSENFDHSREWVPFKDCKSRKLISNIFFAF